MRNAATRTDTPTGLVLVATRLPRELAARLERDAVREGRSLSAYVRRLVERAVHFGIGVGTESEFAARRKVRR